MRRPAGGVRGAAVALAAAPVLVALLAASAACTAEPPPQRGEADGASVETLTTEDGLALDARLWDLHAERVVIYLHEYREDQSSWWSRPIRRGADPVSALTLDFRGHGASEGEQDDIAGMVLDVRAAIEFVRDRGYELILLMGAGMGAALAMHVAAEDASLGVVGLSAPSKFDVLEPLAAAPALEGRIALAASRDDLSAAHSLQQFRAVGEIDLSRSPLYAGNAHGVAMLDGRAGAEVRAYIDRFMARFWQDARTPPAPVPQ